MSNHPNDSLLQLQQLGLIDATINNKTLASADAHDSMPWFLHLFFGSSGVLASLLFIGFLSLLLAETGALDSAIGLFMIGAILSAAGFLLFKTKHIRTSTFMSSLAFALSVAGQLYIAFALFFNGFFRMFISGLALPLEVWLFLFIQVLMTFIVPSFIYRLLSSLVALGCIIYLLNFYNLPEVSVGLIALLVTITHLQRFSILKRVSCVWHRNMSDVIGAVGYASAIMLLSISVYFIAAEYGHDFGSYKQGFHYNYYLAQGLLTLASLYATVLILRRYAVKLLSTTGIIIFCATAILGVMSVYVSGLLATCLIIVIATANSQRVLLGLGVFALVGYIFWYYYQLDTSLLLKSTSMLIIGIGILLMRWLLIKRYFGETSDNKERLL